MGLVIGNIIHIGKKVQLGALLNYFKKVQSVFNGHIVALWKLNDASGTIALDSSGHTFNGAYAGTVMLDQPGIYGDKATNFLGTGSLNAYSVALKTALNYAEGYFSIWVKAKDEAQWTTAGKFLMYFSSNDDNQIIFRTLSGLFSGIYESGNVQKIVSSDTFSGTRWINLGFRWSKADGKVSIFNNGVEIKSLVSALSDWVGLVTNTRTYIMANTTGLNQFAGTAQDALILDYAPTDAEIYSTVSPSGLVMFEGDSRMAAKGWSAKAAEYINPSSKFTFGRYAINNEAVSGSGLTELEARAAVTNARKKSRTNILVVWIGVNSSPLGATEIYNRIKAYCIAARAAGWNKIVVCTEIDAQDAYSNANNWHTTVQPALNTLLRGDYSFADALADLATREELQDATNTTYFNVDRLHPITAGSIVVSEVVGAALDSIL